MPEAILSTARTTAWYVQVCGDMLRWLTKISSFFFCQSPHGTCELPAAEQTIYHTKTIRDMTGLPQQLLLLL